MVNTNRGRFTSAFWRSLGVFLLSIPMGSNAVEISNGVPEGTVGHYRVDVTAGGETRAAFVTAARLASIPEIFTTNVVFDYSSLVDPESDGFGFSLSDSDSVTGPFADPNNPNIVTSSGSFLGLNQNVILWTAVSSIATGAQVMTTTYTFTAQTGVLGPLRLLQYLDEDVQGNSDDVFFSMGLAVSGDLRLFTFDNADVYGLSHSGALLPGAGLLNASFEGWAADVFPNMRPRITSGPGQPVSPTGINNLQGLGFQHPQLGPVFGPADIVSVLAWDVDPNAASAVITTSLGGVPISAQTVEVRPVGNPLVGNPLRCRGRNCTFQATCILPPSPGALCTNQIKVTVTKKALRSRGGATVKAPGVPFASGAANVAPGQIGNVRLKLTKRGRQFVRSGKKKKLRGIMEISNVAGTSVSAIPITIRIKR